MGALSVRQTKYEVESEPHQSELLVGAKILSDFVKKCVKPTSMTFRDFSGAF